MTLEQFLNLFATILGAFGSIYVLKGLANLTPRLTERLSAPIWGHNLEIMDSYSRQKAESQVGIGLLTAALIIGISNMIIGPVSIAISPNRILSIIGCFILSVGVLLIGMFISYKVYNRHRGETARYMATLQLSRLFTENPVSTNEIRSLRFLYEKHTNIEIPPSLSNIEFLRFVANDVACEVPMNIIIEEE